MLLLFGGICLFQSICIRRFPKGIVKMRLPCGELPKAKYQAMLNVGKLPAGLRSLVASADAIPYSRLYSSTCMNMGICSSQQASQWSPLGTMRLVSHTFFSISRAVTEAKTFRMALRLPISREP